MTATTANELLERDAELARADEHLANAKAGSGRVLVIEGPAGIGKTALLQEVAARASDRGLLVLRARGGELERDFPHGVVRQLFEADLLARNRDEHSSLLAGAAALARPVLLPGESGDALAADASFAVTHGLYWLTANLAEERQLMLAVDDAQWADIASLRFLAHLARRLEGMPLLLAVCIRSGEPKTPDALLAQLTSDPTSTVIRPAPLTEAGVGKIIGRDLGADADAAFTQACHRATGGTPFLVRELVSALRSEEIAPTRESVPHVDAVGPRAVAQAILRRVAQLPPAATELARAIAVLSADVSLHRAVELAEIEHAEGVTAADALIAMSVLAPGQPLDFVHPVVREAIYEDIPATARAAAHARAADLLAAEHAELDAIAAHLLLTEPAAHVDTIARLREASQAAARRGAPESAVAYLRRALAEGGLDRDGRAALLLELGKAERRTEPGAAAAHLEEAYDIAQDPTTRGEIVLELMDAVSFAGQWERSLSLASAAIADLQGSGSEIGVRLEAYRAAQEFLDSRYLPDLLARLPRLRSAARGDTPAGRLMALLLSTAAGWTGQVNDARELVEIGIAGGRWFDELVDSPFLAYAFQALVLSDEVERAAQLADEVLREAKERASIAGVASGLTHRGWIYARTGDLRRAEADLRESLAFMQGQELQLLATAVLPYFADAIVERPELDDIAADARQLEVRRELEMTVVDPLLHELRGRVRIAHGEVAGGIEDLIRCGETIYGHGSPNAWQWRPPLAIALAASDPERALELAHTHVRHARRVGLPRAIGVGLRTLGVVEGGEEGLAHLEEAVGVLEDSPARLELARALVELGAARRRAGHRADAREPLREGLDLAHRCGATRLEERARQELLATGARPRRAMLTGRDALTATEQRIAGMAAEGMSNPEIAQALFVTRKTVENHLSRIYPKLGINSREQLPQALER